MSNSKKNRSGSSADRGESKKDSPADNANEQETLKVGMRVLGQYIKDLSFENPNAPYSLQSDEKPFIDTQVGVTANKFTEIQFEVVLQINVKSTTNNKTNYNLELTYAGVFEMVGVSKEQLNRVVLIECPRLLLPFARQIVLDATRNGGYPPLMLEIFDFADMYRKKIESNFNQSSEGRTIN